MPNHKVHERINWCLLCGIAVVLYWLRVDLWSGITFTIGYIFSTYFVTPDLDLDSKIYKRWYILKVFWCPYKEVFKHRQCSHHVVFGPISLVLYLAILIYTPIYYFKVAIPIESIYLVPCSAGMVVAIEAHIVTDWLADVLKRKKK